MPLEFTPSYPLRHGPDKQRIIDGLGRVSSQVPHLDSPGEQEISNLLFVFESGVV
jgi:hypothetical protein